MQKYGYSVNILYKVVERNFGRVQRRLTFVAYSFNFVFYRTEVSWQPEKFPPLPSTGPIGDASAAWDVMVTVSPFRISNAYTPLPWGTSMALPILTTGFSISVCKMQGSPARLLIRMSVVSLLCGWRKRGKRLLPAGLGTGRPAIGRGRRGIRVFSFPSSATASRGHTVRLIGAFR